MKRVLIADAFKVDDVKNGAVWGWRFWFFALLGHFAINELTRRSGLNQSFWVTLIPQGYFLVLSLAFFMNAHNRRRSGIGNPLWLYHLLGSLMFCMALVIGIAALNRLVGLWHPVHVLGVQRSFSELIFLLLIAPVCEEMFFRAALIPSMLKDFQNIWLVILYAALVFMVAHFSFYGGAMLLGVATGYLFVRFQSPYPGIIFHSICNLIAAFAWAWFPNLTDWCFQIAAFRALTKY